MLGRFEPSRKFSMVKRQNCLRNSAKRWMRAQAKCNLSEQATTVISFAPSVPPLDSTSFQANCIVIVMPLDLLNKAISLHLSFFMPMMASSKDKRSGHSFIVVILVKQSVVSLANTTFTVGHHDCCSPLRHYSTACNNGWTNVEVLQLRFEHPCVVTWSRCAHLPIKTLRFKSHVLQTNRVVHLNNEQQMKLHDCSILNR